MTPGRISDIVTQRTRDAVCAGCGAEYKQVELTAAWRAMPLVASVIPGGWVPLDCPSCERRNLSGGQRAPGTWRSAGDDRDYARVERLAMPDQ